MSDNVEERLVREGGGKGRGGAGGKKGKEGKGGAKRRGLWTGICAEYFLKSCSKAVRWIEERSAGREKAGGSLSAAVLNA